MDDEAKNIIDKISKKFNPIKIIVFGSYANGNVHKDSDLDLLLILETTLPKYKRASLIKLELVPYSIPLDLLIYTPEEYNKWKNTTNHIIKEIDKNGIVVYERK